MEEVNLLKKNLYLWFEYIEKYLSGLEVTYNVTVSKDTSTILETFAKANSFSIEEAISKILLSYINKIVKIE